MCCEKIFSFVKIRKMRKKRLLIFCCSNFLNLLSENIFVCENKEKDKIECTPILKLAMVKKFFKNSSNDSSKNVSDNSSKMCQKMRQNCVKNASKNSSKNSSNQISREYFEKIWYTYFFLYFRIKVFLNHEPVTMCFFTANK